MSKTLPLLTARALTIGYPSASQSRKPVAETLDLDLWPGQLVCLLGPNGAGKSTLMRTLAGLQSQLSGDIAISGQSLAALSPGELAQTLSLVLTDRTEAGNLTVYELVSLGRTPYTGWLGTLTPNDKSTIRWALEVTETREFAQRRLQQLSDGERQKVMLARALAQDTPLILLDEPTAHLDLPNRVDLMRLLRLLARQTGKAILLSTHELDLALQAADQLWLLSATGQLQTGLPEDLVLNGAFEASFARNGFQFDRETGRFIMYKEADGPAVYVSGAGSLLFWTQRALQRAGFTLSRTDDVTYRIEIMDKQGMPTWISVLNGNRQEHTNLAALLDALQAIRNGPTSR